MKLSITPSLLLACCFIIFGPSTQASEKNEVTSPKRWITITSENDIVAGDDGGYTNGFAVSWGQGAFDHFEGNIPAWMNWLSEDLWISTADNKKRGVSYLIGQQMFTPSDIEVETLIPDDRPYAGVLAWQGTLHSFDEKVSDRLSLLLGILGPDSGAESTQKFVHKITGSDDPEGWDNQLENEALIRLQLARLWRLNDGHLGSIEYDIIGRSQASAGNYRSDVGAGLGFRLGRNLGQSFAFAGTLPGREINPLAGSDEGDWHVFLNLSASHVFNDITLDGNTNVDSHEVDLEHNQTLIVLGVAFNINNWGFVLSTAQGSDQFETQEDDTEFGSMSVTYQY